jgi:uncharacterized protein (DUF58 family)
MRYLDPVALSKVGTFPLRARTIVEGALTGLHRSPHHGSSVEFAEHKEYSPGDEIKHIDWKAYGKFDRYYVKRFEEETELTAYLLLDRSGSMSYRGDGLAKLEYAAYLVAALAYLLIRQQDRVGLYAFGGREAPVYVPPRARSTHLHDLYGQLERVVDSAGGKDAGRGPTALAAALDRVAETARRRRSLILVVSDMFDASPEVPLLLRRLRAQRHDVTVFQTLDRHELDLPFEGMTLFESLEDDRRILADPRAVRDDYLRELGAFLARTRRACADGDVEHHLVPTDQPLEQTLLNFLTARARARAGAPRPGEAAG